MLDAWTVVTAAKTKGNVEQFRVVYGSQTVVSRVGRFNLVHLDSPDSDEIRLREDAFDPDTALDESYPLWRKFRLEGADVIFLGRKKSQNGIGRVEVQSGRVLDENGSGRGPRRGARG